MKDLTYAEFNNLKSLAKNELISQLSIDILDNDLLRVTIISVEDADFKSVDALIEGVFPGKTYRGSVGEDTNGDLYFIDVEGETLVNLLMKKSPEPWTLDEILRREG